MQSGCLSLSHTHTHTHTHTHSRYRPPHAKQTESMSHRQRRPLTSGWFGREERGERREEGGERREERGERSEDGGVR